MERCSGCCCCVASGAEWGLVVHGRRPPSMRPLLLRLRASERLAGYMALAGVASSTGCFCVFAPRRRRPQLHSHHCALLLVYYAILPCVEVRGGGGGLGVVCRQFVRPSDHYSFGWLLGHFWLVDSIHSGLTPYYSWAVNVTRSFFPLKGNNPRIGDSGPFRCLAESLLKNVSSLA